MAFISQNPVLKGFGEQPTGKQAGVSFQSVTTDVMTLNGTIVKSAMLMLIVLVTAAASWILVPPSASYAVMLVSSLVALGFGLWASFSRSIAVVPILLYSAAEGTLLGIFSRIFEERYSGIVAQAIIATLTTMAVVFVVYRLGILRATARFNKILLIAMMGYLGFILVMFLSSLLTGGAFNIYSGGWAWLIPGAGAILAALTFVSDFGMIEEGIASRAPERFEWRAAFGLILSLVWLYINVLRLLGLARS